MINRLLRTAALIAGVLAATPAAASAGPTGSLQQLPSPGNCVTTASGTGCGTLIEGGTTTARSIAVSPDGDNAYVASGNGAVTTFGRNERTGALSFSRCLKDRGSTEVCQANVTSNTDLEGIISDARWIVVSPDGKNVYVGASSGTAPLNVDSVTSFARNTATGVLTPLSGKNLCISETLGGDANDTSTCRQGYGLSGLMKMDMSPDGKRLYAISPSDSTLAVLIRDPATGALTQAPINCFRGSNSPDTACDGNGDQPVNGLNNPSDVAVSPDSDNVYTVSRQRSTLVALRAGTTNGGLTLEECERGTTSQETCVAPPSQGLNAPNAVEVSPDGNDVYTASAAGTGAGTGNTLTEFDRNAGTGGDVAMARCIRDRDSLAEAPPPQGPGACSQTARGLKGATEIAIKPGGKALYVTADTNDDIAEFSRDPGTGDLEPIAGADQCIADGGTECPNNAGADGLTDPVSVTVSPDGLFVYATAIGDDAVSAFSVQVPPTCQDVTLPASPSNKPVTVPLRCQDPNGDPFTLLVVNPPDPSNGTVTINQANDTATFTPATGFAGTETFTFRARDIRDSLSNVATARVTIAAPGAPVITASDAAIDEGDSGTTNLVFTLSLSSPLAQPTTVAYGTQDLTAVAPGDYASKSGTATFAANQVNTTVTVAVKGDLTQEATERFALNLSAPTNGAVIGDSQAIGTVSNDDTSIINVSDVTVAESAKAASFTVSLTNPSDSTVEATYSTADDTAKAPGDYTSRKSLKVSFAPGEKTKTITVPVVDDKTTEQTERFSLVLSAPTGGATLGKATGVATVTDDDKPTVSVSGASVSEGNAGPQNAVFTISLSAPVSGQVKVAYATADESARQPEDYAAKSGTVTFAAGETSKTVTVVVAGDTQVEPDETFLVKLSNPSGATLGTATGTGTILNDDQAPPPPPLPTLAVSDVSVAEGDAGTRDAPFTVSLSAPQSSPVTVRFGTADETANGADYRGVAGTLTFAPGEVSKPVPVPVIGDDAIEPDERFRLVLADPSGATLGKAAGVATITNDDAPVVRIAPRGVSVKVTPKRDRSLPFRFTTKGRVRLPSGVKKSAACLGRVSVQVKLGNKTISTRRKTISSSCRFKSRVTFGDRSRLPARGKLKVTVRFLGNAVLLPAKAKARQVRFGKPGARG